MPRRGVSVQQTGHNGPALFVHGGPGRVGRIDGIRSLTAFSLARIPSVFIGHDRNHTLSHTKHNNNSLFAPHILLQSRRATRFP